MLETLFSLQGRVALVTGGSKGLGEAMSRALAAAGCDVAICSRHAEEAAEVARSIHADTGREVLGLQADTGDPEQVERMVERTVARLNGLDILINNAGINRHSFLQDQDEADWDAVLRVDLTGPMLCARAAARYMIPARAGRIINISSVFGLTGYPKRGAYCASKGGLVNLTRCMAVELAPHNVTVNCICPGPFDTPLTRGLVTGEARDEFTRRIPMGRWGDPKELVGAILYFASDAASFTTGSVLTVDGGWTAI
jgi:NAD(P)-dependent dehydrogenase (short-subunit alcohol dehydrogenase family)